MQHGTLSSQHTITAPLGEIVARVQEADGAGPGVLVIGQVVGFREHLQWFDNRPLFGRRVLVTRSRNQAPDLVELLELNGAEAVEAPVLRISPPADPGRSSAPRPRRAIVRLGRLHRAPTPWRRWSGRSSPTRRTCGRWPDRGICAVGPGTASRLHRYGVSPDLEPGDHRTPGVIAAMADGGALKGARVLLPVSDLTGDTLGGSASRGRAPR